MLVTLVFGLMVSGVACAFTPKPIRGSGLLAARERRAARVAAEQKILQAALKRDERRCRVPRCEFAGKTLPIDPCHLIHRGMGGNPKGDRTTRDSVIALCRVHHGRLDAGLLEIDPLTPKGTDGVCDYRAFNEEDGRWEHIGTDRLYRVSEERNPA